MSHVAEVDVHITDLVALKVACERLGLVLNLDQQTYRWWGTHEGDYPIPQGYTEADLGKCLHAISIPNNKTAYEIGVVERRDGKPGYTLHWDFFGGGYGMQERVGDSCSKLRQLYSAEVAKRAARRQGQSVQERKLENGQIQLVIQ